MFHFTDGETEAQQRVLTCPGRLDAHEGAETEQATRVDRGDFCINTRVRKKPTTPPNPGGGWVPIWGRPPASSLHPRTQPRVNRLCKTPFLLGVHPEKKSASAWKLGADNPDGYPGPVLGESPAWRHEQLLVGKLQITTSAVTGTSRAAAAPPRSRLFGAWDPRGSGTPAPGAPQTRTRGCAPALWQVPRRDGDGVSPGTPCNNKAPRHLAPLEWGTPRKRGGAGAAARDG